MVKKKKSVKRTAPTFKNMQKAKKGKKRVNKILLYFFNILIIAIFVLGLYKIFFEYNWMTGLFIIVLDLVLLLALKLYYKLRK